MRARAAKETRRARAPSGRRHVKFGNGAANASLSKKLSNFLVKQLSKPCQSFDSFFDSPKFHRRSPSPIRLAFDTCLTAFLSFPWRTRPGPTGYRSRPASPYRSNSPRANAEPLLHTEPLPFRSLYPARPLLLDARYTLLRVRLFKKSRREAPPGRRRRPPPAPSSVICLAGAPPRAV